MFKEGFMSSQQETAKKSNEKELSLKFMDDKPVEFSDVLKMWQQERKGNWASQADVRASIEENKIKVEKFKSFKDFQIKTLGELSCWKRLEKYFYQMGLENVANIPVAIIDNDEFWKTFYGEHTSKAVFDPKSMFVVKSVYDAENVLEEKLSAMVQQAGKLVFHDILDGESENYVAKYEKRTILADSAMDSVAYQMQIDFLRSIGKSKEETKAFLLRNANETFGFDDELTQEELEIKQSEIAQIMKYLDEIYVFESLEEMEKEAA